MWIWICVSIIAGSVLLDQLTKWLVVAYLMPVGESVPLIDGVLQFTYVENPGAAFGIFSDHPWVFMVISTLAIAGIAVYLFFFRPKSAWACVALSLIIGGGVGNMIDRIRLNYVIDFVDFCAFPSLWKWVFNVADACVCVGGAILCVWLLASTIREERENRRRKKEKEAPSEET